MSHQRVLPLTGTDLERLATEAANELLEGELHATLDQNRVFYQGYHVGPVWHGLVADAAEMLTLTVEAERGVFPMDKCYRSDRGSVWMCITNRGEALEDWLELSSGSGGSEDIVDGGDTTELTDVLDGGDASNEPAVEIDGNPPI